MPSSGSTPPQDPRDLAEFVLRWPEFRAIAERSLLDLGEDRQKAMVLGWLIRLAERVGPHDLAPHDPRRQKAGRCQEPS